MTRTCPTGIPLRRLESGQLHVMKPKLFPKSLLLALALLPFQAAFTQLPNNEALLTVDLNITRYLEVAELHKPEDLVMSQEEAAKIDMVKRLNLQLVQLHILPDPDHLFTFVIGIHDPAGKVWNEMTNTELGKQFFENAEGTLKPKLDAMGSGGAGQGNKPAPPAQISDIAFKQLGTFIVGGNPRMLGRISQGQWDLTQEVTTHMANRVKTASSFATIALSLPENRNLDWIGKMKGQEEVKKDLGMQMMLGMAEGIGKQILEKIATTNALAVSIEVDGNKRRSARFAHYSKTPEAANALFDTLNANPGEPQENEGPAKAFARLLHSDGIEKEVVHDRWFVNVNLNWEEASDRLFKQNAGSAFGKPKTPVAPPPPAATSTPVTEPPTNGDEPEEPSLDEQIAKTIPLEVVTKPFKVGDKELQAEVFQIVGKEFIGERSLDIFKDVEVIGNKLYIAADKGEIHAFVIVEGTPPKLEVDATFGENGVLKTGNRLERLSRDGQGHLVTDVGFGDARFFDATGTVIAQGRTAGNVSMHPSEPWGISYHFSRINKVILEDGEIKQEPWEPTPNEPVEGDKKPFSFFNPVLIDADCIAVGCQVKAGDKDAHAVAVFDYSGKELFRFGNTESVFEPDGFCYLHDAASHPNGYVVSDSNCRKLSFWDREGKFIGGGKSDDILGVRYPWMPGCTATADGTFYLVASQKREKKDGVSERVDIAEGLVYRIKGL